MWETGSSSERVVVAMSGGVDSSMAAALLVEQGYQAIGLMMRLWAEGDEWGSATNRCCSPSAVEDARRVCRQLDIPFYLLNFEQPFKEHVVDYFVREYARGRTPNPCLACNRHLKFDLLLRHSQTLGAGYLATGHYARMRELDGRYQLLRGVDAQKDQSYALYMLGQVELRHLLLPLGHYTKAEVRAMARERGLPVAEKDESQEICFVLDGDYRAFLQRYAPQVMVPGPILDTSGRVIGQHRGLPYYTISQRRGLGIAAREPLYVLEIDRDRNALVVGTATQLGRTELVARELSFVSGQPPVGPVAITARIRYQALLAEAVLTPVRDDEVIVKFTRPQRDITPGQAVVFYQDEVVLGGGVIA